MTTPKSKSSKVIEPKF